VLAKIRGPFRSFPAWFSLVLFLPGASPSRGQSPGDAPSAALKDALVAACAQNSQDFVRALTARNAQAFGRMTPPARGTLLKRFVLLDKAGKPHIENDAEGRVLVYCATPDVTTVMAIDKPEIRDNLAYVPLAIREANDAVGVSAHHVTMGLIREDGQWKLVSLGLLFLDLPSLEAEWDRAEIKANEQAAIASLKQLVEAIENYRKTYLRLPDALKVLGPAANGAPKAESAGLVDEEMAAGRKDGYAFRYVIVGASTTGAPAKYEVAAIPSEYGRTGLRSFFCDTAGVTHAGDHKGAVGSDLDPKLDESAPGDSDSRR
jgi:hypothetical protein